MTIDENQTRKEPWIDRLLKYTNMIAGYDVT